MRTRQRRRSIPAAAAAMMVLLAACGEQPDNAVDGDAADESVTVLAKAQGWRDDLGEAGGVVFEVADNAETGQRLWDETVEEDAPSTDDPAEPGLHGQFSDVDFSTHVLASWSFGESGSCPEWVDDVRTTADGVEVSLATHEEGPCTDDFNPYRLVLAIDRDGLPEELPAPLISHPEGDVVAFDNSNDTLAHPPSCSDVDALDVHTAPDGETTGTDVGSFWDPILSDGDWEALYAADNEGTLTNDIMEWLETEQIDEYAGGWVDGQLSTAVVAFTDNAETYAAHLRQQIHPGIAVAEGSTTFVQMQDILADLSQDDHDDIYMYSGDAHLNRVSINIQQPSDERLAQLAADYGPDAICLMITPDPEPPSDTVELLAKADGWREQIPPDEAFFAYMEVAYDRQTAQTLWAENVPDELEPAPDDPASTGVHGTLDDVDFDTHVVVVWNTGQSGSCPEWIIDFSTEDDEVVAHTATEGGVCDDDYRPYRAVLAVDRGQLPQIEALPVPITSEVVDRDTDEVAVYPAFE